MFIDKGCKLSMLLTYCVVVQVIPKVKPPHVFGLAVYEDYLFWTDWVNQAVMRCDKYTGENAIELRKAPRPMGIVAVSNSSLSCKYMKESFSPSFRVSITGRVFDRQVV